MIQKLFLFILSFFIFGCDGNTPVDDLLEGRKIDYMESESQKQKKLQYPPDVLLTAEDGAEATVSLKQYTLEEIPEISESEIVPQQTLNVYYRRDGGLRWVEVELPPNNIWDRINLFWTEALGFGVASSNAEVGSIETDWLELRESLLRPGLLGGYLSKLLNDVRDSGERDKFITRIERNEKGGTDIFISHRHLVARFNDGAFVGYERMPADTELEVEMLRRLMLYLANRRIEDENQGDSETIDGQIAEAEQQGEKKNYSFENNELWIYRSFNESWQLAQAGLDRGGFTIEDRDFKEGIIYIRHSGGPDSEKIFGKAETSFFNRLFGEERPILREIELVFTEVNDSTLLQAKAVEGDEPLTDLQESVILELLFEYLP